MAARSLVVAPLVTLLTACSSAPSSPPLPPPASSAAVADPAPGWTPHDPRIVRCGVDDRPRSVVSALPPPPARALLAEMAAPRPARRIPPPIEVPPPIPDSNLQIVPGALVSRSGSPVPTSLASIDPHYEVCSSLIEQNERLGPVTLGLELASNGSPLRVLPPPDSRPTPLVRCLMERACQLQATATPPGVRTVLDVPLLLESNAPDVAPPPGGDPRPLAIDVSTGTPRPDRSELQLRLRAAASSAMHACGPVSSRVRVRVSLDLAPASSPRRPRHARAVISPALRVVGQRTDTLEGDPSLATVGCVLTAIRQLSFPPPLAPTPRLSEQVILTWNP